MIPGRFGDRIQVGPDRGDVVDQRIFQFTLLEVGNWVGADQSTGRIIHVPNQKVFTEPVANFTADFDYLWNEVGVLISFESDWRKAKELIASVAHREVGGITQDAEQDLRQARGNSLIFYRKLSPIVYTSVVDSGVLLTLRYLCRPRHRRGTAQAIWESLLDEFSPCEDIDFAYPAQRVYYDPVEGKPARQTEALSKDATARAPSAGRGSTGTSPHPPVVGETRE